MINYIVCALATFSSSKAFLSLSLRRPLKSVIVLSRSGKLETLLTKTIKT